MKFGLMSKVWIFNIFIRKKIDEVKSGSQTAIYFNPPFLC